MSVPATPFQQFFSEWCVDMNKFIAETETWYANMLDQNPTFNFTGTSEPILKTIRNTFESNLLTLQAEL